MIGALISGVANLASGIMSNAASRRAQKRQQSHEIAMWEMNNAYNTPLQQRKRMVEGGFNPALMYSGGVSNTSSSPARTVEEVPDNPAIALPAAVEAYINYTMMDKQKELIDANIAQKNQSVMTSQKDLQLKDYQLNHIYPATVGDIVARSSFNKFKLEKETSLLPGQLQAQEFDNQKRFHDVEGSRLSNVGKSLDNWAKRVSNSSLEEKTKAELFLLQERVVGEVLNSREKSTRISASQLKQLIDMEILQMRRNLGKPQASTVENLGLKLYERVREALGY